MTEPNGPHPHKAPQTTDMKTWAVYLVKELGVSSALIAFICYLLAVQIPSMQHDFRMQTNALVEAVGNNTRAMGDVVREVKELRQQREWEWKWFGEKPKPKK